MEFFTSCLWKFCLVYGILAFSDGNSRFESGSPDCSASGYNALYLSPLKPNLVLYFIMLVDFPSLVSAVLRRVFLRVLRFFPLTQHI